MLKKLLALVLAFALVGSLPASGMLQSNQLIGFGVAGGGTAAVSYIGTTVDAVNATTYTHSGVSIGVAVADRKVVVATANASNDTAVSGVTIDGNAMTLTIENGAGSSRISIWELAYSTGTTAEFIVTNAAATGHSVIHVFRVTGAAASASDTCGSVADPLTDTITVLAGGVVIAVAQGDSSPSFTPTNVTEEYDAVTESEGHTAATATSAAGGSLAVTLDQSANSLPSMACATWGPS